MFRLIRGVLTPPEVVRLRQLAQQVKFVDGRATNLESAVKRNLQVPQNDPSSAEPGTLLRDALFRNPELRRVAFPRQMARPTLSLYEPGMAYGWHVDEALFPSNPPMRSDLSCTVWLSEPDEYEGGELCVQLGDQEFAWKANAGDALLYPSTTIHQVKPVTRGRRMVGISWIQSYIADPHQRELLLQTEEARTIEMAERRDPRMLVLLESMRTNLFRMWSDG